MRKSKPKSTKLTVLGRKVKNFTRLETFPRPLCVDEVTCISDEVTATCPITNQPDWYEVTVQYWPKSLCVESKSLKLYLQSFRNQGHFCENFSSIIQADLKRALKCDVVVTVNQKPRGGIRIISKAGQFTSLFAA